MATPITLTHLPTIELKADPIELRESAPATCGSHETAQSTSPGMSAWETDRWLKEHVVTPIGQGLAPLCRKVFPSLGRFALRNGVLCTTASCALIATGAGLLGASPGQALVIGGLFGFISTGIPIVLIKSLDF